MKTLNFEKISTHNTPESSPGFLLWHISTSWRGSIEAILKPMNLTHPQFVVLTTLGWLTKEGNRTTQAAIGKMANLDPNTTSQVLKGLEQKKWIKREKAADARAKNPLLTATGQKLLVQALPLVEKADSHFFASLKKQEIRQLIGIFRNLYRS
ncbi:MAG: MarR family transcriptional regulator [Chlamydiales bacterium]|nr:MarR family transcriptional regulator [Chlamydiales bacterium]